MSAMQMPLLPEYGRVDVTMIVFMRSPSDADADVRGDRAAAAFAHDERVDVEFEDLREVHRELPTRAR